MAPRARWNRLTEILERAGYENRVVARALHRDCQKWYDVRDSWCGVGSAYLTVGTLDSQGYEVEIQVRMSDHAQKAGGGMRYRESMDDFDRAGDSEVSIHPGSGVTLRNVLAVVEAKLAEAVAEMEKI